MTISGKVESAYAQLITALAIDGLTVYTGINDAEKEAPCAVASVTSVTEDFPQSGIWHVKTTLAVAHIAADTDKATADTLADSIFSAAVASDIAATLTGLVEDFEVYDVFIEGQDETQSGDAWVKTINLDVVCTHGGS